MTDALKLDPLSMCRRVDLPQINDPRGNLTLLEGDRHIPSMPKRVYYLYDVPGGATRAGHAHRRLHQFLIAASGSFTVSVRDGKSERSVFMNRSYTGLYIPPMIWRVISDFSSGSVCLALASEYYDESDHYRDFEEYRRDVLKISSASSSAR